MAIKPTPFKRKLGSKAPEQLQEQEPVVNQDAEVPNEGENTPVVQKKAVNPENQDDLDIINQDNETETPSEPVQKEIVPSEQTDEEKFQLTDAQIDLLVSLSAIVDKEDQSTRETLLMQAKKHHDYFRTLQGNFWNSVAGDWTIPTDEDLTAIGADGDSLDRVINIVRAHGESLISALGSKPPACKYFPEDAENEEDKTTAKAFTKLEKLINKHNDGPLLFFKSLFLLYLEGIVFSYNFSDQDEKYGQITKQDTKKVKQYSGTLSCPDCGATSLSQGNKTPDVPQGSTCSSCDSKSPLEYSEEPTQEEIDEPFDVSANKIRQIVKVFGFLDVKIPLYAREFCQCGYLRLNIDEDESLTREKYPEVFNDICNAGGQNGADTFERWARISSQYLGSIPPELSTTRIYWFRPWFFNKLGNPEESEDVKILKEKFSKGCRLTLTGSQTVCEIVEESLDKHWNVSVDPLCNFLHSDAIVIPLIPIQDVKNEVYALSVETIEHGIMETFVDSEVLDLTRYAQQRAQPGMKYPVKSRPGKGISESFYQDKAAQLTEEVGAFDQKNDQEAQFVIGSFPSIYGGPAQGGSKTLGEYSQSRAQALQRLGIVWQKLAYFFSHMYGQAVPNYANALKEAEQDEKFVEEQGTSFINVWIKVTELEGSVGDVFPENSDQLPTTWAQRKQVLMDLLTLNNPQINIALMNPQNTPFLRDAIGLDELYIPGEGDRDKQYAEFVILLEGKPELDDKTGQLKSTVPVNEWDDHEVELATCRFFLISDIGLNFAKVKPEGIQNIVAHMGEHHQKLVDATQAQLPGSPAGVKPESNAQSQVE